MKADLNPYMLKQFSYADIFASLCIWAAVPVCQKVFDWDILNDFKNIDESLKIINGRNAAKEVYEGIYRGMKEMGIG